MDYSEAFVNQEIDLLDSIIDFNTQMTVDITQTLNCNVCAREMACCIKIINIHKMHICLAIVEFHL